MRHGFLPSVLVVLLIANLAYPEPDPQKWARTIEEFEKQDKEKAPPKGAVLFTGSSSITRWKDVADYFPGVKTINRGFGGSSFPEVNHYLEQLVLKHEPRVVVVYCGSNDMAAHKRTPEQVRDDFKTFAKTIQDRLPKTRVVFLSIHLPPGRLNQEKLIQEANALVLKECVPAKDAKPESKRVYLDIHPDMLGADGKPNPDLYADPLHPTAKAYKIWADKLRPLLTEK